METVPRWNFPRAAGGRSHGFKDAGVATFSGKIVPSLVREICQNSLDAGTDSPGPVRVEFEKYTVPTQSIPGYQGVLRALGSAWPYWNAKKSEEVINHLKRMKTLLREGQTVSILRASDFKTTGLRGAYEDRISEWTQLTKMDGGATKGDDKAGSYGIGKNASFAASELRMVFCRTLTDEPAHGGRAAQGIMHLPAYPTDIRREMSTQTLGIGYFGDPGSSDGISNLPIPSITMLDDLNQREEIGTDVFVFGMYHEGDWFDQVAAEILESFLVAIYRSKLEVVLAENGDRIEISSRTLPALMERYGTLAKNAASYYHVLNKPEDVRLFEYDFHGMGTLNLSLVANTSQPLNRKILVVRTNEMKIRQIDRISRNLNFTGILELSGVELNKYFRRLETPAHDAWEPDRYTENPREAKKYMQELRRWVVETVTRAAASTTQDKMHVKGLSDSFQTGASDITSITQAARNAGEASNQPTVGLSVKQEGSAGNAGGSVIIERSGAQPDSTGDTGTLGGSGNTPKPRGRRRHKRGKLGGDGAGSAGIHTGSAGGKSQRAAEVDFSRLIRTGPCNGRLVLMVPRTIERGSIMVQVVGENGARYEGLQVNEVRSARSDVKLQSQNNRIRFEHLPGGEKVLADVTFEAPLSYAVGISVYEDK